MLWRYSFCIYAAVALLACNTTRQLRVPDKGQSSESIVYSLATLDHLGNLYYCSTSNEVRKFSPDGQLLGYFSNNQLGRIGLIDATSPLKVLIYYPSFYSGIILDRWMNQTSQFNSIDLGLGEVEAIGLSKDGTLWAYDNYEQKLKKVDQQGQVLVEGEDLRLILNRQLNPKRIIERGNQLYMLAPADGVLVFDLFGNYIRLLSDESALDFQLISNAMVIQKEDSLELFDTRTFMSKPLAFPLDAVMPARILLRDDEWMIVHEQGVQILQRID